MNKIVIVTILFLSSMYGISFNKKFDFQYADSNLERKAPVNEQYILSYSNVLEKIRTSVVNISTKKKC